MEDVVMVNRSSVYAAELEFLDLEYVDCVDDNDLSNIAAVCRGTLLIKDYYSHDVEPKILLRGSKHPLIVREL
jgi:hypothetical protein